MKDRVLIVGRHDVVRRWGERVGTTVAQQLAQGLEARLRASLAAAGCDVGPTVPPGAVHARCAAALAAGASHVVLVSALAFGWTASHLAAATAALEAGADLAVAPTPEGDAGQVALGTPALPLLQGLAWGAPQAVTELRNRAFDRELCAVSSGGVDAALTPEEALDALPGLLRLRQRIAHGHGHRERGIHGKARTNG